ncbi:MAG: MBOAT family O-acyltransferase [Flavobacteriales bacterium]
MLFNSIDFAVFLPLVFLIHWGLGRSFRAQNAFLLLASMVFYGWWDWRYLGLVGFSALVDYVVGLRLFRTAGSGRRKLWLALSLTSNLGLLGFFKYFDFFLSSFNEAFTLLGRPLDFGTLGIVLPVGISFYTFQTLSYTIDIYRRQLEPVRDPVAFGAFILFFPQLVAGPIERAANLLPQFMGPRTFAIGKARDGLRQVLWGLFKKVVIADTCAQYVNLVYADPEAHAGSTLLLATVLFAFQIYGDFSGYSDIAIGTARLLGFDLMRNFAYPYFSRDIGEFWRRWHISLSTWFRDYLYIPLGGSRGSRAMQVRNALIVFTVSGFWHGANWTFLAWGLLNGLYFVPLVLARGRGTGSAIVAQGRPFPSGTELRGMATTFLLTVLAWVAFRADSLGDALTIYGTMASSSLFEFPLVRDPRGMAIAGSCIAFMLLLEWWNRERQYGLQLDAVTARPVRLLCYYATVFMLFAFAPMDSGQFIYFQF